MAGKVTVSDEKVEVQEQEEVIRETPGEESEAQETKEEQPQEAPKEDTKESKEEQVTPEDLLLKEKEEKGEEVLLEKLQKYAFKDELTEEDIKEIEQMGLDPQVAALAIKGMKTEVANTINQLYEVVGGKEQYQEIAAWANENLSQAEREEFNNLMKSNDPAVMRWALKGLKAAYLEANQEGHKTYHGTTATPSPNVKPYSSYREFVNDLKKQEYKKDPKFRELVDKRLAISKF